MEFKLGIDCVIYILAKANIMILILFLLQLKL